MRTGSSRDYRLTGIAGIALCACALISSNGCVSGSGEIAHVSNNEEWTKKEIVWGKFKKDRPFIAMFEGWRGSWPNYMHVMAKNIEYQLDAPVYVTHVHFWRENMERIREAHKNGFEIMLAGYSAGGHQAYLAAKECEKEKIPIKKMVFYDPTFTNNGEVHLPDNVFEAEAVYSNSPGDWLSFARGQKGQIVGSVALKRVERDTDGNHLGAFTWEKFKSDWERDVRRTHVEKLKSGF